MQRYRRLYHCSRCLLNSESKPIVLPRPSAPEPLASPSVVASKPLITSIAPKSNIVILRDETPKAPPKEWTRETLLEKAEKNQNKELGEGSLSSDPFRRPQRYSRLIRKHISKDLLIYTPVPLPSTTTPTFYSGWKFNGRCCTLCNWTYSLFIHGCGCETISSIR